MARGASPTATPPPTTTTTSSGRRVRRPTTTVGSSSSSGNGNGNGNGGSGHDSEDDDDDEDNGSSPSPQPKKRPRRAPTKSPIRRTSGGDAGRRRARASKSASRAKDENGTDDEEEDEDAAAQSLLASVSQETRKLSSKRQRRSTGISEEFMSLDALLDSDAQEQRRRQNREAKLRRLREEQARGGAAGNSPLARLMSEMESNMSSLSADSHLFAADGDARPTRSQEKFGFVFSPITEALPFQAFKATAAELASDLGGVYAAMQTTDAQELAGLLWSRAILVRALLGRRHEMAAAATAPVHEPVVLPSRICAWLFLTMSTHRESHVVQGCLGNLFVLVASTRGAAFRSSTELTSGLPGVSFVHAVDDLRRAIGPALPDLQMEWRPTVYDFLNAFRRFGFQDSKRSMSAKSKITPSKAPTGSGARRPDGGKPPVPFPTRNMHTVLAFLVLCLRTNLLRLDGYDAFSFTMFFLRMQFEHNMHPEIVQLAGVCIEELLEVFPLIEWRKEWAPSLVLRIAGVHEGLFDSAAGWLTVARRLPRTKRGTQLTTGLAIYVLQHRIDRDAGAEPNSERPHKFPMQSGLVLDIVAGIVEDLTAKYTEKRRVPGASRPPYDLLCKKVALMDLALQAFLNELTQKEMALLLKKLDDLTGSHKSTMSAKWHELKTLVSLMHRKYSLENLRVGRDLAPGAKTVLFVDDPKDDGGAAS